MQSIEQPLATVLGDHPDDCATLEIASPRGDFPLQFATGTKFDGPVWTIASEPPREPPTSFQKLDEDSRYVILETDVQTPAAAALEASAIIQHIGGDDAEVEKTRTYRISPYRYSVTNAVRFAQRQLKQTLKGVSP